MDFSIMKIIECKTLGVYEIWIGSKDSPNCYSAKTMLVYDMNSKKFGKAVYNYSISVKVYNLEVLFEYIDENNAKCYAVDLKDYVRTVNSTIDPSLLNLDSDIVNKLIIESLI